MKASSSFAKRAAAVAASGCTKLDVMNSASEFSPHCDRGKPSRTAIVERRTSSGNSTREIFLSIIAVYLSSCTMPFRARRGRRHVDLAGTGIPRHLHDLFRGGAAHD